MKNKLSPKVPSIRKMSDEELAVVAKLNKDSKKVDVMKNIGSLRLPDISNFTKQKIKNNESIVQLFPDIELSIEILTSSILSPNDLLNYNLIYKLDNLDLPSEVKATLLDSVKTHSEKEYKIKDKLPIILKDALFIKGAYVEAVLPEASVDEIINMEIYNKVGLENRNSDNLLIENSLGIFEKEDNISVALEELNNAPIKKNTISFTDDELGISFSDNPNLLQFKDKKVEMIKSAMETRLNNYTGLEEKKIDNKMENFLESLFKINPDENEVKTLDTITVKTGSETVRKSVGKPLVLKLPVESVIPIHVTGKPEDHLGYFVMVDENGLPISDTGKWNVMKEQNLNELIKSELLAQKSMVEKANKALKGITSKAPTVKHLEELYSSILEKRIKKRLESSIYGDMAEFDNIEDIYRTMLSRTLKNRKTRLLFLPKEIVSYYAFRYRENGTGESLLELVSVLGSIRAILLFTRLLANMKNSVTTTNVDAELDENDPDPEKTMEMIISEVMKTRQTQLPIGVTRVDDLTEWAHRVGFKFNFKHPNLPNMEISTDESNTSKIVPDDDLEEEIRKFMIMSFGLTPEIVENGFSADFATTIVANNLLLTKRVLKLQNELTPMISNHLRIILKNDFKVRKKLEDIIEHSYTKVLNSFDKDIKNELKKGKKEDVVHWLVDEFLDSLVIDLPKPDSYDTDGLNKAFKEYTDNLDDAIGYVFSEDAMPDDLGGELAGKLDALKDSIKSILVRRWMSENNYLPDLLKLITIDEDGKPYDDVLKEYLTYVDNMSKSVLPFLKLIKKSTKKIDDKLEKIENDNSDDDNDNNDDNEDNTPKDDNSDANEGGNEETPDEGEKDIDTGEDDLDLNPDDGTNEDDVQ